MSKQQKRSYRSISRQKQAEETKKKILDAAKKLFKSEGYEMATIEKIAKSAGVSAATIFSLFKSKRGILRVFMDEALSPLQYQALVEESEKAKSIKKRLEMAAKIARQLYDAEKAQMEIFPSAAVLSSEFKELEKEREDRRYLRLKDKARQMAKDGCLAEGMKEKEALDILWAFTGRDLYRMLVIEKKWSSDQFESWLSQLLVNTLLKK